MTPEWPIVRAPSGYGRVSILPVKAGELYRVRYLFSAWFRGFGPG
jgi:hypothetical protein